MVFTLGFGGEATQVKALQACNGVTGRQRTFIERYKRASYTCLLSDLHMLVNFTDLEPDGFRMVVLGQAHTRIGCSTSSAWRLLMRDESALDGTAIHVHMHD